MAPDLNSVSSSNRPGRSPQLISSTSSRRPSDVLSPAAPISPNQHILPSNQVALSQQTPSFASSNAANLTTTTAPGAAGLASEGTESGPGPLRHPRPLTAAELHLQLEKEQEAVINRLTRELSLLRAAQNASVVSNASSTSTGIHDQNESNATHSLTGVSQPTLSHRQHHRSSSSTSIRSLTAGTTVNGIAGDRTRSIPTRQDSMPRSQSHSRQDSITGIGGSGASSPALANPAQSSYQYSDHSSHSYYHRPSVSLQRHPSSGNVATLVPGLSMESAQTTIPTTGRYEEAAFHRHELEAVKRENDALRRRIMELERTLSARRNSDLSRTRSESVSTTASVSLRESLPSAGRGREREKDSEDDGGVRLGENIRGTSNAN